MNSSPVGIFSRAGGISEAVWTDLNDSSWGRLVGVLEKADMVRERMVSLRATSKPLRSSAGWGSWMWCQMCDDVAINDIQYIPFPVR